MTKRSKKLTGFPLFFAVVSAVIFVCFAVPAAFGLQSYNQWGGMYDEHWCYVQTHNANPHVVTGPDLKFELLSAGDTGTRRVYSGPMNNTQTCLMWARSRCGKKSTDGTWTIEYAVPYLKGFFFAGEDNICDKDLPSSDPWFFYNR